MMITGLDFTGFDVGDDVTLPDQVCTGLPAAVASVFWGLKQYEGAAAVAPGLAERTITASPGTYGQIVNAGAVQLDGTYTAVVRVIVPSADTALLAAGHQYWLYIRAVLTGGQHRTLLGGCSVTPQIGGQLG